MVLEDLITYSNILFDDGPGISPPLPPAPLEEPATSPVARKPPQDFSPTVLQRADAASIHPSGRRVVSASSPPTSARPEQSPLPREALLAAMDLASPSNDVPPAPPPASEKKRFEGIDFRSDHGHGSSPRRSLQRLSREEGMGPVRRSLDMP